MKKKKYKERTLTNWFQFFFFLIPILNPFAPQLDLFSVSFFLFFVNKKSWKILTVFFSVLLFLLYLNFSDFIASANEVLFFVCSIVGAFKWCGFVCILCALFTRRINPILVLLPPSPPSAQTENQFWMPNSNRESQRRFFFFSFFPFFIKLNTHQTECEYVRVRFIFRS